MQSPVNGTETVAEPSQFDALLRLVWPTNATEFWTMVTAIVTIGLGILAWRGLNSLRLAKADMLTRSQREARACALAKCEELANELIPKNGGLITRFAAANVPLFVDSADAVRFDPDASEHLVQARQWMQRLPKDLYMDSVGMINKIEAWAMYFTNGVADHSIAFGPCAPVFCSMIVRYYPLLLVVRAAHSSGKYPNAVQLFKIWRGQLEAERDGVKMQDLIEKMKDLQQRRTGQQTLPPPLGTADVD